MVFFNLSFSEEQPEDQRGRVLTRGLSVQFYKIKPGASSSRDEMFWN